MRITCLIFMTALAMLTGCGGSHYVDYFPNHDDGTPKPKVAILPVRATCPEQAPFAEYFDKALRWNAMDQGELYLYSDEELKEVIDSNRGVIEGKDRLKAAQCFRPADFVVEVELIENKLIPFYRGTPDCFIPNDSKKCSVARLVKLRVRVVDVRCECPKVVLYEVIERSQAIPVCDESTHQTVTLYERLSEHTTRRIEEVIWCRK